MGQIGTAGHLQSRLLDKCLGQISYSMSLLHSTFAQTAWPDATLLCYGIADLGMMPELLLTWSHVQLRLRAYFYTCIVLLCTSAAAAISRSRVHQHIDLGKHQLLEMHLYCAACTFVHVVNDLASKLKRIMTQTSERI